MKRRESFDPPYDGVFAGLLKFATFAEAEETLRRLEELRLRYRDLGDRKGEGYCRELALLGRRRAEQIARNPRVAAVRRLEKGEIALWFRIWLETPALFETWLELRRRTDQFRRLRDAG
jgi:hypothetical protein